MSLNSLNTSGSSSKQYHSVAIAFSGYNIREYDESDKYDAYSDNDEFETAADEIVDFAESNPFVHTNVRNILLSRNTKKDSYIVWYTV